MGKEQINYHGDSIAYDMLLLGDDFRILIENILNKIKILLPKK